VYWSAPSTGAKSRNIRAGPNTLDNGAGNKVEQFLPRPTFKRWANYLPVAINNLNDHSFRSSRILMPSHGQLPTNNNAARGLPTVKPPSGRFILQLFLIPGLIVAGLVVVFVFGSLLWVGTSTPESYLSRLDNTNPDVRWRAAHDLAQVLKRPESLELASDPDFALDLSERLLKALAELEQAEEAEARDVAKTIEKIKLDKGLTEEQKVERGDAASKSARAKYRAQRHYVWYLISCLGDFTVPVGVNALDTVLRKKEAADLEGLSMRRTRAVLALANLGNNMKQRSAPQRKLRR
jgi:hypothetical protein